MKRRAFTFGLAALAAAPAMPLAAAQSAPVAAISAQQFALAKLLARAHNHCTTDMLARHMKITPKIAAQVQGMLLDRGVITQPIAGASMATNPINTHCIPKEALKPTNLIKHSTEVRSHVRKMLNNHKNKLLEPEFDESATETELPLEPPADAPSET